MAATAAALRTYIEAREPAQRLISLTTQGTTSTSSDTTVLEGFCTSAIAEFNATLTTYDPDNFAIHYVAAWHLTMTLLIGRAEGGQELEWHRAQYDRLAAEIKKRRSVEPSTNSPFTQVDEGTNRNGDTVYSPFSYLAFDGYRAGNTGSTQTNPGTWPPD